MISTLLTALLAVAAADPPAKLELFAKEDWYKSQAGKEETFVGVLKFVDRGKGVVGFGRFNPYTLEMTQGDKKTIREVYVGGKPDLLKPYIGQTIKFTGKAVDMEVEGKNHHEIWPARLEVVVKDAKPPQPADGNEAATKEIEATIRAIEAKLNEVPRDPEKERARQKEILAELDRLIAVAEAKEAKELTVVARGPWGAGPKPGTPPIQLVLRSPEDLAKATKMTEEQLAKQFKVDKIDWKKQMIVVATAGARSSGGFKFDITNLTVKGDTLTVKWKATPPDGFATAAFTHPGQAVLVERFEGKVVFDPPVTPEKKEPKEEDGLQQAAEQLFRIERQLLETERMLVTVRKIQVEDVLLRTLGPAGAGAIEPTEDFKAQCRQEALHTELLRFKGELGLVRVLDEKKPESQELKILGRGFWRASSKPGGEAQQIVIRSAEDLAKASGQPAEQIEKQLAQQLKVEKIDWKTQMLVVVTGGAKPTGGYSVEVESLTVKDKVLTVKWKLNSPKPGSIVTQAFTHPAQLVLAERFEGEVKFDPPAPKGGAKDK